MYERGWLMIQWEYESELAETIGNLCEHLALSADEGWELVAVLPLKGGGYKAFSKRPKAFAKTELSVPEKFVYES